MTISAGVDKDVYDGDGATTEWPITFSVTGLSASDIKVYKTAVTGISTLLTSNYTIDLEDPETVTYPVSEETDPLAEGEQIIILPVLDIEQESNYTNQGGVPPAVLESDLDRLIRLMKQINEKVERSAQSDISEDEFDATTLIASSQAAADAAAASAASAAALVAGSASVTQTFVDGDLTAGVLTVTHNLALATPYALNIVVFDNNGKQISPDEITGSSNSHAIDISSFSTITGTWAIQYNAVALTGINANSYASINAAVTAIGAIETTLIVTNAQTLAASLTIPSTLALRIESGGSIVKASTHTLTINGAFDAGLYQVFSGFDDGDVTFGNGSVKEVYPEWWKTNTTPGTTDMTDAVQAAVTANNVCFSSKYLFSTVISVPAGRSIRGLGVTKTQVTASACDGFDLLGSNTELSDFSFYLSGRPYTNKAITSSGLYPANFAYMKFSRLLLDGWNIGIHLRDVWDALIEDVSTVYINNSFNLAGLCARVNFVNCFTNDNGSSATSASVYLEFIAATSTRPEGIKMIGCHFFGGEYGVYAPVGSNSEVHISNCSFDVSTSAIHATGGNHWVITNNSYVKSSGSEPTINILDVGSLVTAESIISNNTIYNSGSGEAIYIGQYNQNWVVNNNTIKGGTSTYIIELDSLARDIIVANNLFILGTSRIPTIRINNTVRRIAIYNNQNARVSYNDGYLTDCSIHNNTFRQKVTSSITVPTLGNWNLGDKIKKDYIALTYTAKGLSLGDHESWICTKAGSFSGESGTASTTLNSAVISSVDDADDFLIGEYITVSTGFDSATAPMLIISKSGTTLTLDTLARTSTVGATIAHSEPVFSELGQQGYRSGATSPAAAVTPYFIGEEYLDSTGETWYKSYGATNADWAALN